MASVVLVLVCLGVILYRCYKYMFERPDNFPPGPPKIPIFGSYLFFLPINYKHIHRATETMARWYNTSILGYHYKSIPSITTIDLDSTKEMLNNSDMDGRPVFELVRSRDPFFNVWGIFFRENMFWRNQRRFTLRHFRDFGFGRRFTELEIHIEEELRALVDLIKNGAKYDYEKKLVTDDGLVSVPHIFSGHPANLFLKVVTNERFSRKDLGTVFQVAEEAFIFQRWGCVYGRIFSVFEWLKYIIPNWSGYNDVRKSSMAMHKFANNIVLEQFESFEPKHERHYLDLYFKNVLAGKEDYTLDQLTHSLIDFMFPALSAIASTVTFTLQRLIQNSEYMEKCQRQIDEVVGNGRFATLDDRINLPYVEAALRECLRLDTLVASNVPHKALQDTKIGGYDLPKGGLVIANLQAAHTDEKHFKNPYLFRPERFLGVDGKLNLKSDPSVPFGAGKRLCAGETFARNTLFLVISTVLQNFNVSVPEGHSLIDPSLEPQQTGLIKTPLSSYLKFTSR